MLGTVSIQQDRVGGDQPGLRGTAQAVSGPWGSENGQASTSTLPKR